MTRELPTGELPPSKLPPGEFPPSKLAPGELPPGEWPRYRHKNNYIFFSNQHYDKISLNITIS